jgi:hypothetical protein
MNAYVWELLKPKLSSALVTYGIILGSGVPALLVGGQSWKWVFTSASILLLVGFISCVIHTASADAEVRAMHRLLEVDDQKTFPIYRGISRVLDLFDLSVIIFWFYLMVKVSVFAVVPGLLLTCMLFLGVDFLRVRKISRSMVLISR